MKITGMIVLILVILVAAALAEVWRELHCFKVTDYQIRTSKMGKNTGKVRIAFLSDLHNHVYGKENADLLDAIREAKPDLILAGGDMLVGKIGKDWSPAAEFMKKLPQIAPVWCCNGNHEQRTEWSFLLAATKKAGMCVHLQTARWKSESATLIRMRTAFCWHIIRFMQRLTGNGAQIWHCPDICMAELPDFL